MTKGRLEAFSDGVLAIIITIMVLELKPPHDATLDALAERCPAFIAYVVSFVYVGIYWNNHHHLMHTVERVNGRIMWANLNLLFWLSLLPILTGWVGEHHESTWPAALYGVSLLSSAVAWLILQSQILRASGTLAKAIGGDLKGRLSPLFYVTGIALAFVRPWAAELVYALVALIWIVPDRRIERLEHH